MNVVKNILGLGLVLALTACGTTDRFAVDSPQVTEKINIRFSAVEVRDVSLPTYAADDEIHILKSNGTMTSSADQLWADSPERAVALELSENLSRLTGRRIASEPWPFEAYPDARLLVRLFHSRHHLARKQGRVQTDSPTHLHRQVGREMTLLFSKSS